MAEGTMLNGHKLEEVVGFFKRAYEPVKTGSKESALHDPFEARRNRIHSNTQGLEDTVKGILGSDTKADKARAEAIVKTIAYEIAKAEGYKGDIKELTDKDVRKYLSQASAATGDPVIGNKLELIKSIMSMISAKPGTLDYNADAPLGHLIGYTAAQRDEEAQKINYFKTVASEHWTEPGTGVKLQRAFASAFNIPLGDIATASNLFNELETRAAARSQLRKIETTPKPYLQTGQPAPVEYKRAA